MIAHKIKTLLIEDSAFMRIFLSDLLRKDREIELLATAGNGLEGVEKVRQLKPDVVITDMLMPDYDGLFVVQHLMNEMPLPIILLSSLSRTDPKIFDALKEGAFDFIDKPTDSLVGSEYQELTDLVREASVSGNVRNKIRVRSKNTLHHAFDGKLNYDVITIGASTGGPGAVESIVNNLPSNLTVPVVIAQHMPERFINSFANRLADTTGLNVSVAQDGVELLHNRVYLAPGNFNIRIEKSQVRTVFREVNDHYKEFNFPSIDCLMESVANVYGSRSIGVILTGMGKDGSAGLKKIKEAGGLTVAQDASSSVVYGMPKSAYETGAALHQLPLEQIPNFIISAI